MAGLRLVLPIICTAGFIRRSDLSRDRDEQRPERFATGEKVDAQVTMVDSKARKLSLSIKAREMTEEKQAMANYGSSDSGASLGDILGAALAKRETPAKDKAKAEKSKKAKTADKADAEPDVEVEVEAEAEVEFRKSLPKKPRSKSNSKKSDSC